MEKIKSKTGYFTIKDKYYYQEFPGCIPVEITADEYSKATQGLEKCLSFGYGELMKTFICIN